MGEQIAGDRIILESGYIAPKKYYDKLNEISQTLRGKQFVESDDVVCIKNVIGEVIAWRQELDKKHEQEIERQ